MDCCTSASVLSSVLKHTHTVKRYTVLFQCYLIIVSFCFYFVYSLDYGPETLRLEAETLRHFPRRGGSWLWRLSPVIHENQCHKLHDWNLKCIWLFFLPSCPFLDLPLSRQGVVLLVVAWGAEPHVLSVWVRWEEQLLPADQPSFCNQPRPPLIFLLHRQIYCNGMLAKSLSHCNINGLQCMIERCFDSLHLNFIRYHMLDCGVELQSFINN